jgi:hypothetical protein
MPHLLQGCIDGQDRGAVRQPLPVQAAGVLESRQRRLRHATCPCSALPAELEAGSDSTMMCMQI